VKERMEVMGLTPADVARRTGIHEKLIYKYLQGLVQQPRGDVLARLARELGTSELYLRHGTSVMKIGAQPEPLPLLPMSSLAQLTRAEDVLGVWDKVSYVSASFAGSSASFVVRVDNESGLPEFSPGDDILCDPGSPLVPGRLVFAVLVTAQLPVFGRYRPASPANRYPFTIEPVNRAFPPVSFETEADGFILARAVRHIRDI
jgi:transcriptional regulator with XRE-family HTH domain